MNHSRCQWLSGTAALGVLGYTGKVTILLTSSLSPFLEGYQWTLVAGSTLGFHLGRVRCRGRSGRSGTVPVTGRKR